jgi:hypothetical protein
MAPIGRFQRGTCHDGALAGRKGAFDDGAKLVEPRPTIAIRERNAVTHFLNVYGGVEAVAIVKHPAKFAGEQTADGGFAGSADAGKNHDHFIAYGLTPV